MTLKEAYNYGIYFLSCNGVEEAEFKSLCLVCHLAGIRNSQFEQHINDDIIMKRFADLLWRVKSGEPLQYVIGRWDFYESEFFVGKGVLIPRPETEELVELAVRHIRALGKCVVYDLCAGSGAIGVSIAKSCPNACVYMIEKSADAMFYLLKNADGVDNAKVICGDIANDFDLPDADVILSNPPYILQWRYPLYLKADPTLSLRTHRWFWVSHLPPYPPASFWPHNRQLPVKNIHSHNFLYSVICLS